MADKYYAPGASGRCGEIGAYGVSLNFFSQYPKVDNRRSFPGKMIPGISHPSSIVRYNSAIPWMCASSPYIPPKKGV